MKKIILAILLLTINNYALEANAPVKKYTPKTYSSPTYYRTRTKTTTTDNSYLYKRLKEVKRERNKYKRLWNKKAKENAKLRLQLNSYKKAYDNLRKSKSRNNAKYYQERYKAKQKLKKEIKGSKIVNKDGKMYREYIY